MKFDIGKEIASFEIAEGFTIELVASEPDIADPVDMEIDEFGNMYVVEMHGYPLDTHGAGRIKLLRDSDGDGDYDRVTLFAKNLILPNSLMRWKQGLLVTAAPYLFYLEDVNGDGQADILDTIVSGFALSNPQHKVNSPTYGLDNWIYLANQPVYSPVIYNTEFGDKGKPVRYHHSNGSTILPANAEGRRVRIKPDEYLLEMTSSSTQFSQSIDQWGNTFLGNNTYHIYHEVLESKYLLRNSDLVIPSTINQISSYGIPAEVYPITENPEHQIFTSVGVFTSACGVTMYLGGVFPDSFNQVAFVAEPVGNLVHACKIVSKGSSYLASRVFEKKEFLASKDSWFRPVNHYIGPDGSLFVVDYHRRVIEHPEWMGQEVINEDYLYAGNDKGRIYRISSKDSKSFGNSKLPGYASDKELIAYLSHPNIWWRMNAQRILVDHNNQDVVEDLKKMVLQDDSKFGRLHAAWTLEGLKQLTKDEVILMLEDDEAGIRENGIRLSEGFIAESDEVVQALYKLKNDKNKRVLFQLLCTLGYREGLQADEVRSEIIFNNMNDRWIQYAGLSASNPNYQMLLDKTISNFDRNVSSFGHFLEHLIGMYSNHLDQEGVKALINRALTGRGSNEAWKSPLLKGLSKKANLFSDQRSTFLAEKRNLLSVVIDNTFHYELRLACQELLKTMGMAPDQKSESLTTRFLLVSFDANATLSDRLLSLDLMSLVGIEDYRGNLYKLLIPSEPLEVQKKVLSVLAEFENTKITEYLVDEWASISPELRKAGIDVFTGSPDRIVQLIEALEMDKIESTSIDFHKQVYLMTLDDETLRNRARKIFDAKLRNERSIDVIARYGKYTELEGDFKKGEVVFQKNCASCHQIEGQYGTAYGPDLGSMRNREASSILNDILNPGVSIADGFDYWEITLVGGKKKLGIIESETPTSVVLKEAPEVSTIINRAEIESMKAQGVSLMPIGLENVIEEGEMIDLIVFLKSMK